MDDWLKRDRFVFIGWSGLILFPCAYLCLGGWFTGTTFISSWFTQGLSSSYIEGCNFLTATVSTPANCMDHSSLCSGSAGFDGLSRLKRFHLSTPHDRLQTGSSLHGIRVPSLFHEACSLWVLHLGHFIHVSAQLVESVFLASASSATLTGDSAVNSAKWQKHHCSKPLSQFAADIGPEKQVRLARGVRLITLLTRLHFICCSQHDPGRGGTASHAT